MTKVDAIVIGGGRITDSALREAAGVDCKSLISLHGKPMIHWVVDALRAAKSVGSVVVVGPECLVDSELSHNADCVLPEEDHEIENLMKGMAALPDSERILMVASDMPLLTPQAIDDLVQNAPDADVVYPTIGKQHVLAEFPDRKWVFVRAQEGEFTGSSAVIFQPQVFRQHNDILRKVFDSRRSVADLVRIWGVGFAVKFALGQLSLKDAERRISEVLKISGRTYISRYPELAFDVDKASDVTLAEERVAAG